MRFNELWFWRIVCSTLFIIVFLVVVLLKQNLPLIWELHDYVDTNQKAIIQLQEVSEMYLLEKLE